MHGKKIKRRLISVLLSVVIVIGLAPTGFATEGGEAPLFPPLEERIGDYTRQEWMDGVDSNVLRSMKYSGFINGNGYTHTALNASWIMDSRYAKPEHAANILVPQNNAGLIYGDINLDLTGLADPHFSMNAWLNASSGDGIGITLLVDDGEKFWIVGSGNPTQAGTSSTDQMMISADLAPWAGEQIILRILADRNGTPNNDSAMIGTIVLTDGANLVENFHTRDKFDTGIILQVDLDGLMLQMNPPAILEPTEHYNGYDWMEAMDSGAYAELEELETTFEDQYMYIPDRYIRWRWNAGIQQTVASVIPASNGASATNIYADIPLDLTGAAQPVFSMLARMARADAYGNSNGAGIALLVKDPSSGSFYQIAESVIIRPASASGLDNPYYGIEADLSRWAGKAVTLRIFVTPYSSTWAPDVELSFLKLLDESNPGFNQGYQDWNNGIITGFITALDMDKFNLDFNRPDNGLMDRHRSEDYDPDNHLLSVVEDYRPLFGAHIYLTSVMEGIGDDVNNLNDWLDFAAHSSSVASKTFDLSGMPWVYVQQPNIPLGRSDTARWSRVASTTAAINSRQEIYGYVLGATMGSEPHTNPGYTYTGHTKEEIDNLGVTGPSAVEFGQWMGSLYGTAAPSSLDANGHSFETDFGYTAPTWEELHIDLNSPHKEFLRTLFGEYCIQQAIIGTDEIFGANAYGVNYTSRLLSRPYNPLYSQSMRQLQLPTKATGVTYYVRARESLVYNNGLPQLSDTNPAPGGLSVYDPAQTEFQGSLLYQQSLVNDLRVVYNEHSTNSGTMTPYAYNTRGNLYRGIFNELQYKPAIINLYAYMGGTPGSGMSWYDIHPYEGYIATLRGQLELGHVYEGIQRETRDLGIFVPVAAPDPVGWEYARDANNYYSYEWLLSRQLEPFGPDVLLTSQHDNYELYENLILVLGFIEGETDAYLTGLLQDIPDGQKIMVMAASSELYTEPSGHVSADYTRSLQEVLPISPNGTSYSGGTQDTRTIQNAEILGVDIDLLVPEEVYINANMAANGTMIYDDAANKPVAWVSNDNKLMVLIGIPTAGMEQLAEAFFDLEPQQLREAGTHKILNRGFEEHTATEAGWYSVDKGQTLYIGAGLVGYDLVRRVPVGVGGAEGETVVRVIDAGGFEMLDAGTGNIWLEEKTDSRAVVTAKVPRFDFDSLELSDGLRALFAEKHPDKTLEEISKISPEFILYSANGVTASINDMAVGAGALVNLGGGFYKLSISVDGEYVFEAGAQVQP